MKRKADSPLERAVKKSPPPQPIDCLEQEALDNLCLDSDDSEQDADYYDVTNGCQLDQDWFRYFCHKCAFDREHEEGICMACEAPYVNFFEK